MIDIRNIEKYRISIFLKVTRSESRSAKEIIELHKKVADKKGYSWWGNNQPFTREKLIKFFNAGQYPKVIMVIPIRYGGSGNICYIADIVDAKKDIDGMLCPEIQCMPQYYVEAKCKVWLKLKNIQPVCKDNVDIYDVNKYFLISNNMPLNIESRYSLGYVYRHNENIYSANFFKGIKMGIFDSWEIIDENTAIKKTDISVFEHNGSGIPKEITWFFNTEKESAHYRKNISIIFQNHIYDAYLSFEKNKNGRVRIFWHTDLKKEFNKLFSEYKNFVKKDFPLLQFVRKGAKEYIIDFVDTKIYDMEENDLVSIVDVEDANNYSEGRRKAYYTTMYERNPKNRKKAIKIHGTKCIVCNMLFENIYGERGKGYIEIHHKKPLFVDKKEIEINVENDLVPICANCHRMIHRKKNEIMTVEELREIVEKHKCKDN